MDSILALLGLMRRANKLLIGEDILNNLQDVYFIFMANDASIKSINYYLKKANNRNINYSLKYNQKELSMAIGKKVKFIALNDEGFYNVLLKKYKEVGNGEKDIQKACK